MHSCIKVIENVYSFSLSLHQLTRKLNQFINKLISLQLSKVARFLNHQMLNFGGQLEYRK